MLSVVSCIGRAVVLSAAILVTTSITMSGEWGEEGVTYGHLGKDVTLECAGGSPGAVPEWRWKGSPVLPEGSVVQHGQLILPQAELSSEGIYSCHDASGLLLNSVTLRLGRKSWLHCGTLPEGSVVQHGQLILPQAELSSEGIYSCHDASGLLLNSVTLRLGRRRDKGPGSLCLISDPGQPQKPEKRREGQKKLRPGDERRRSPPSDVGLCIQDPAHPQSCTVNKSQFWSSYRMNVTEANPLGSSFRLLDFTMQAILKPDPPEGLRVEPVPSAPRRLRVSWEYPSSWPNEPHFQLKFRLQYRPVVHSSWSMVETANVSELITDALMGLDHVVRVSAKDFLDAGSWSEWSSGAWGRPALGQTMAPSEAATAAVEPESPAEEPSLPPNNEPVAGHSDPLEKVAVLVSLGVFAFFVLAVILIFALLMWIRMKKHSKEATKNHDLLSATIHMKALPKAQIL
ncbi:PREDICTED: interleukin-11 receptor subunit alpha, partial [Gekko japonicus]|uniref:Interleukin-11 receptor subunit alpha n=1 Tax=Gekko japonicus TaxID=146911 RepID=A0ABM1JKH7_GEKJA